MLDSREDVKVGECSDNGEEDDGFYGCVGCMESERTQEGSHCRNKSVRQLLRRTQEIKRQADERNVEETRKKRVIARVSQGKSEEGKATVVVRYTTDFLWTQI